MPWIYNNLFGRQRKIPWNSQGKPKRFRDVSSNEGKTNILRIFKFK